MVNTNETCVHWGQIWPIPGLNTQNLEPILIKFRRRPFILRKRKEWSKQRSQLCPGHRVGWWEGNTSTGTGPGSLSLSHGTSDFTQRPPAWLIFLPLWAQVLFTLNSNLPSQGNLLMIVAEAPCPTAHSKYQAWVAGGRPGPWLQTRYFTKPCAYEISVHPEKHFKVMTTTKGMHVKGSTWQFN